LVIESRRIKPPEAADEPRMARGVLRFAAESDTDTSYGAGILFQLARRGAVLLQ